jgi:hypothetical protein
MEHECNPLLDLVLSQLNPVYTFVPFLIKICFNTHLSSVYVSQVLSSVQAFLP